MQLVVFLKTLVKSSLDNYVLPGTLSGTEILWLYMKQWGRDLADVVDYWCLCSPSGEDSSGARENEVSGIEEGGAR